MVSPTDAVVRTGRRLVLPEMSARDAGGEVRVGAGSVRGTTETKGRRGQEVSFGFFVSAFASIIHSNKQRVRLFICSHAVSHSGASTLFRSCISLFPCSLILPRFRESLHRISRDLA